MRGLGLRHLVLIVLVLLLLQVVSDAHAENTNPLHQHPTDYLLHSAGGYLVSNHMQHHGYSKKQILATVLAAALLKEYVIDKNPDASDALAWFPGVYFQFKMEW
jgi:hypothetical protein